mgnify:FL=1
MRTKKYSFLVTIVLLCFSGNILAQKFQVKVVKISDGDTFTAINRDNLQLKFRIWGIDAPEKKQAFGTKSKEHLSSLIFGKTITVDVQKQDGWGRYIAYVFTPENKDVGTEMIKAGMAWQFIEYDQSEKYRAAELQAHKSKKGLWSDSHRIAPWEFRKKKK